MAAVRELCESDDNTGSVASTLPTHIQSINKKTTRLNLDEKHTGSYLSKKHKRHIVMSNVDRN